MRLKCFVTLFCVLGLAFGVALFVSPSMAQDEPPSSSSTVSRPFTEALATGGQIEEDTVPNAALPRSSMRVAGVVFKPRWSAIGWDWYYSGAEGGSIFASSGDSTEIFNTPVFLPQGAVVDRIRMYYYDNSANNCEGYFTVYDLYGRIVDEWFVFSSGTPGNDYSESGDINHTINYSLYSYVLNWRPNQIGTTMILHGFRIYYYPSGTRYGSALILSEPPP